MWRVSVADMAAFVVGQGMFSSFKSGLIKLIIFVCWQMKFVEGRDIRNKSFRDRDRGILASAILSLQDQPAPNRPYYRRLISGFPHLAFFNRYPPDERPSPAIILLRGRSSLVVIVQ